MSEANHWQLIPADDFVCPVPPAVTRFQQGWQRLLRLLGLRSQDPVDDGEGAEPPDYQGFDRAPAVAALTGHLADWIAAGEGGVCFLLDPPFSGTAAIARDWAGRLDWRRLTPPDEAQIRAVDVEAWWRQQQRHGPWLIDDLARYLLRTASGLRFVRALLPRLLHGELGQGLLVCDSWTFAFIQRAWPLRPPRVYCFAPAGPALLRQLGIRATDKPLSRLAARARGNPGLALALWACRLDETQALPELPVEADDTTAFVLFSLLLHRGLGGEGLQQVLPVVAPDQLNVQLLRLEQCGIVLRQDGGWRLRVHAYLAVRDFLAARDYLLDAF
ncbi:hypothetical protein C7H85_02210 [Zobellella endophytica]|uniref:Uncharacterized protein n=1 Tax=Zobellella endophytica TaxID=2116700 RepID=A0A2P7RBQ5_9GAMM|nr:hypothetical protein [Zobellella endophytica]PSJ47666.1 hypothetical protein C7H85_02210 [Zobellella endophytica]